MPLQLKRYLTRSPHWYIRGSVRGRRVFETTGTDDRKAAEAILIKRQAEILDRAVFGPGATVTFAEAALSYIEDGGETRFLGRFDEATQKWTLLIGHFATTPIGAIGQAEADAAAAKVCPRGGQATRKRHIYVPLCAVLNHAARKGWRPPPAIQHPRVKEKPVQWARPDWVEKVLPHCAPRLRRFVLVSVYTGARLSEVLRLEWDRDIDMQRRTITFQRTKNSKMRTAPMADAVLVELARVPERDRHGLLFAWSDKCHVYRPLRTACRKAGVEYLSPHKFGRHTYATWLRIYAGRDLRGLMEDGGWKDVKSVERYAHTVPGETAAAVAQLPHVASDTLPIRTANYRDPARRKKRAPML